MEEATQFIAKYWWKAKKGLATSTPKRKIWGKNRKGKTTSPPLSRRTLNKPTWKKPSLGGILEEFQDISILLQRLIGLKSPPSKWKKTA